MSTSIQNIFQKKETATSGLYIGLLGAVIGDMMPKPTDIIDFHLTRKWRVELEKEEIDVRTYWNRMIMKHYFLGPSWWAFVILLSSLIKGDIRKKVVIIGSIIGVGAVLGIVAQNILKDKEFFDKHKMVEVEKADEE